MLLLQEILKHNTPLHRLQKSKKLEIFPKTLSQAESNKLNTTAKCTNTISKQPTQKHKETTSDTDSY